MKLRILFISNRGLLPIKDGHTRRSFNILKCMAQDFDVHFLSLFESQEEVEEETVQEMETICRKVEFWPAPVKKISFEMGNRLVKSLFSIQPYTIWRHYSVRFERRALELTRSEKFNVIHCDNLPVAYCIRHKASVPQTITDHDVSYLKCLRMGRKSRNVLLKVFLYFEALKLKRFEKRILMHADLGIVVSEFDRKALQELCPDAKLAVIENGVDTDKFRPRPEKIENAKLVWVGGFDHYPNKEGLKFFLDRIYPLIKSRIEGVSLDIVGGGRTNWLEDYLHRDISLNVRGYVDDPLPYIHRAAVFIAPILSGGGTRLKILEAMAAGKAIVTTRIGCEGISGISGRDFLLADNPQEFTDSVVRVALDTDLRKVLGRNAREFVERRYDWQFIRKKLSDCYLQLNSDWTRKIKNP